MVWEALINPPDKGDGAKKFKELEHSLRKAAKPAAAPQVLKWS